MATNSDTSRSPYIAQLTWLRGVAAFFVIVSHTLRATEVTYSTADEPSSSLLLSLFDLGTFGVVLFFVLSGSTLYISNVHMTGYRHVHHFYIKRAFRIWPAYLVSLLFYISFRFVFVTLYVDPQGHWLERQFLSPYGLSDLFSYLALTFNITGPGGLFNNAYWTLPVEVQYSLLFPLIVLSLRYLGTSGPLLMGLALYLSSKLGFFDFDNDSVLTLAYSFCGGVLIGHIYRHASFRINTRVSLVLLATIMLVASAISNSSIPLPDIAVLSDNKNWFVVLAVVSTFIAMFTSPKVHNRIESVLNYYGTISYSTYLYHNLLIAIVTLGIMKMQIHDGDARLWITFVFTLVTSYIAATMSYKYVERPAISMGRQLTRR